MMETYEVLYIVMDLETTGFTAEQNQMAQIAFIVMDQNMEILDQAVSFVKKYDNKILVPSTMSFTGITEEQMASGMSADELYMELVTLFKDSKRGRYRKPILVGHNFASFDVPFVEYIFKRKGDDLFKYVENFVDDTIFLARKRWGTSEMQDYKLGTCCEKVGIKLSDAHEALADTQATAQLFKYFVLSERQGGGGIVVNNESNHRERFQF